MPSLRLHLPAHPTTPGVVRRRLRHWLDRLHWPAEQADDLVMAVDEAVSNAVEHAYPPSDPDRGPSEEREVQLRVDDAGAEDGTRRAVVTVVDRGRWRYRRGSRGYRGRGLDMMRTLTDSLEVVTDPAGTVVTMVSRPVPVRLSLDHGPAA